MIVTVAIYFLPGRMSRNFSRIIADSITAASVLYMYIENLNVNLDN